MGIYEEALASDGSASSGSSSGGTGGSSSSAEPNISEINAATGIGGVSDKAFSEPPTPSPLNVSKQTRDALNGSASSGSSSGGTGGSSIYEEAISRSGSSRTVSGSNNVFKQTRDALNRAQAEFNDMLATIRQTREGTGLGTPQDRAQAQFNDMLATIRQTREGTGLGTPEDRAQAAYNDAFATSRPTAQLKSSGGQTIFSFPGLNLEARVGGGGTQFGVSKGFEQKDLGDNPIYLPDWIESIHGFKNEGGHKRLEDYLQYESKRYSEGFAGPLGGFFEENVPIVGGALGGLATGGAEAFNPGATAGTGKELLETKDYLLSGKGSFGERAGTVAGQAGPVGLGIVKGAKEHPFRFLGGAVAGYATGVGISKFGTLASDVVRTAGGSEIAESEFVNLKALDEGAPFPGAEDPPFYQENPAAAVKSQAAKYTPGSIEEAFAKAGEPAKTASPADLMARGGKGVGGAGADAVVLKKALDVEPSSPGPGIGGFESPEAAGKVYESPGSFFGPELSKYFLRAERRGYSLRPGLPSFGGKPTAVLANVEVENTVASDMAGFNRELIARSGEPVAIAKPRGAVNTEEIEAVVPPGAKFSAVSDTGPLNRLGIGSDYYTRVGGHRIPGTDIEFGGRRVPLRLVAPEGEPGGPGAMIAGGSAEGGQPLSYYESGLEPTTYRPLPGFGVGPSPEDSSGTKGATERSTDLASDHLSGSLAGVGKSSIFFPTEAGFPSSPSQSSSARSSLSDAFAPSVSSPSPSRSSSPEPSSPFSPSSPTSGTESPSPSGSSSPEPSSPFSPTTSRSGGSSREGRHLRPTNSPPIFSPGGPSDPFSPLAATPRNGRPEGDRTGVDLGLKDIHSIFRNPLGRGGGGGRSKAKAKRSKNGRQDTGHADALDFFARSAEASKGSKRQGGRRQSTGFDFFGLGGGSGGRSKSKSKRSKGRSKKEQPTGGFDLFGGGGGSQQLDRPPLDFLGDGGNVGGPPPIAGEQSGKTTRRKLSELI